MRATPVYRSAVNCTMMLTTVMTMPNTALLTPEKVETVKKWGGCVVINYKTENVDARIKEATGDAGVQVWYETLPPDFLRTVPLLARRGRMVVMAGRQAQPM